MSLAIIGCLIVVGLALLTDVSQTIRLLTVILTVRGLTFLIVKIVDAVHPDISKIINFAGWCLAGLSIVPIIKLATGGFTEIAASFQKIEDGINNIGTFFENLKFWE
jgi:hypothetical protein